jgi:hypothetical protein
MTEGALYCSEPFLYLTLQQFHGGRAHLLFAVA